MKKELKIPRKKKKLYKKLYKIYTIFLTCKYKNSYLTKSYFENYFYKMNPNYFNFTQKYKNIYTFRPKGFNR